MASAYEKLRTQAVRSCPIWAGLGTSAFRAQGMAGWMKTGSWKEFAGTQNPVGLEQEEVMPSTQLQTEVVRIVTNMALNQAEGGSIA